LPRLLVALDRTAMARRETGHSEGTHSLGQVPQDELRQRHGQRRPDESLDWAKALSHAYRLTAEDQKALQETRAGIAMLIAMGAHRRGERILSLEGADHRGPRPRLLGYFRTRPYRVGTPSSPWWMEPMSWRTSGP
jgi:hypothetical protein